MTYRRASTIVLCLSLFFTPLAARAQTAPDAARSSSDAPEAKAKAPDANAKKEAARRFEHAIKLYEDGDYALALAEFERVHELVPDYRVLYNIGQVSIQLGRYARALRTLREYVSRGGQELPADRRSAVMADLASLEARTASIKLNVQPEGTEVSIDGAVVGKSPLAEPLVVDVGERRVQARATGYTTVGQTLTLAGGDWRQITLTLEPEPTVVAQPLPETPTPPVTGSDRDTPARPEQKKSGWLWVGWGTTGALAASSAVAAVLGASAASDHEKLRESRTTREDLDAAQSRAETRLLAADILGVAAAVTGAVTLYFQLSGPSSSERPRSATRVSLGVVPSGVELRLQH